MDGSSPRTVATRLAPIMRLVLDALRAGISVSGDVHARQGWNPSADRHTQHALVRREAMERLKPAGAYLEDGDNLGLPMSGLILRSAAGDVVRVWHSEDGELPLATTRPLRQFFTQQPTWQAALFPAEPADSGGRGSSNLALLWDDDGSHITRFDLVRPYGLDGKRALIDWQLDVLREPNT